MARFDNAYSRLVSWLKIALPLIALAILSTLFLVSRGIDTEVELPFSDAELEEMLQQERLRDPAFAGVTEDGAAVQVGARVAQPSPESPGRATAEGLVARVETAGGGWLNILGEHGVVDQGEGFARLEGGVALRSGTGYRIRTEAVTARFDRTLVETDGAVTAQGPAGRVEAGKMTLRASDDGQYLLDFTDGVRLVYTPPTGKGEDR